MTDALSDVSDADGQPPSVPRKTVERFVKALLLEQTPKVMHPDGRPLFGYRVRDGRYDDLRGRIQFEFRDLLRHPVDQHLAAGFVLYAAETWRRSEDLTHWNKWNVVLGTLGHSEVRGPELYEAVRAGLRWWKRPLVRLSDVTRYLATLVCEGGLPLHLVRERASPFRRYFRELLAHVRDFGLHQRPLVVVAEREAENLPRSLRHEPVYELGAKLVEQLWRIHTLLEGRDGDPIHALDALDPTWRDQLPLRIDDGMARSLLRELIDDVRDVVAHRGAEPRVRRWLELQTDGWVLRARMDTPRSTTLVRLASLFGDTVEVVPRSFRLAVQTPTASHPPFATGYRHEDTVQFEVASARRAEVDVEEAAGLIELALDPALANMEARKTAPVAGGQPLSEHQPWVFHLPDEHRDDASLLADGGCRTRHETVLVAVPDGVTAEPAPGATWKPLGFLRGTNRALCECRGETFLRSSDDDEWRVATARDEDEHVECLLRGTRFQHSASSRVEMFIGLPRVLHRKDSGVIPLPASYRIDWRPAGRRNPWRSDFTRALGTCDLRVQVDRETRLVRRIAVLPASFSCRVDPVDPRRGRIVLGGLQDAMVEVAEGDGLEVEQKPTPDNQGVELSCSTVESPATVRIRLLWPETSAVDLVLPAPFRSAHFITADGTKCTRDFVALDELFAMRAVVVTPHPQECFVLQGRLATRQGVRGANLTAANQKVHVELGLRPRAEGVHEAELRHLVEPLRRAFRVVDDLDLQVQLTLEVQRGHSMRRVQMSVQRYAATLRCEYEAGWTEINVASDSVACSLQRIGVRAFPLLEPGARDIELEKLPTPQPTWMFGPETRSPGPWILYGHVDGVPCTRPRLWRVGEPEPAAIKNAHARAVAAPTEEASALLCALYSDLATGADPRAWEDLESLLLRTIELPASSFMTVAKLVSAPTTLVICLLRASTRQKFDAVLHLRDELPFDWTLLPLRAWSAAWCEMIRWMRERYSTEFGPDEVAEFVRNKADKMQSYLPQSDRALRLLFTWARIRCEDPDALPNEVRAAGTPSGRAMISAEIARLWMELRRRHADDDWPRMHGIETWAGDLPVDLESACSGHADSPERVAIARAPWVAAGTTVANSTPDPMLLFELQRARAFDTEWFDLAHEMYLAVAIDRFELMEKERSNR